MGGERGRGPRNKKRSTWAVRSLSSSRSLQASSGSSVEESFPAAAAGHSDPVLSLSDWAVLLSGACGSTKASSSSCSSHAVDREGHFAILVPFFLLFPWRRVLARAVDPRRSPSSNLHRRLASRAHFPAIVDDDRGRAGTKARAHFAATRPEHAARRNREVATFFSFGFMCDCLWEAPVGGYVDQYKCCRLSRSRGNSFMCFL